MPGTLRSRHRPVDAEGLLPLDSPDDLFLPGRHHPAFAGGEMLDRIEREAGDVAQEAGVHAFEARADRERAILHHGQPVAGGDGIDPIHVDGKAEIVHHADRARARRDGRLDLVDGDVAGLRVAVDEHRCCAGELDRVGGGDVGL